MSETRKHAGGEPGEVREAPASEVKQAWHEYLDRVSRGRQEVVVTRYGKPVMKLSPLDPEDPGDRPGRLVGYLAGTVTEHGDIVEPVDAEWEAAAGAAEDPTDG